MVYRKFAMPGDWAPLTLCGTEEDPCICQDGEVLTCLSAYRKRSTVARMSKVCLDPSIEKKNELLNQCKCTYFFEK